MRIISLRCVALMLAVLSCTASFAADGRRGSMTRSDLVLSDAIIGPVAQGIDLTGVRFHSLECEPLMQVADLNGSKVVDAFLMGENVVAGKSVAVFVEGNWVAKKFVIEIESMDAAGVGMTLLLKPTPQFSHWKLVSWKLPKTFQRTPLRISVRLAQTIHHPVEWAISDPLVDVDEAFRGHLFQSFKDLFLWLVNSWVVLGLLCLPMLGLYVSLRYDFKQTPLLVFPAMLILGSLMGYAVMWIYYFSTPVGHLVCLGITIYSVLKLGSIAINRQWARYFRGVELGAILQLWAFSYLVSVCAGFLYDGWSEPLLAASGRYLEYLLPIDSRLPFVFSERLWAGFPLKPFVGDWLSSDRPPLQAAMVLLSRLFATNPEQHYVMISMLLQCLLIPSAYVWFRAAGLVRKNAIAVSGSLIFTCVFIQHSFYVWPKLFPVVYLLLLSAILWFPDAMGLKKNDRRYLRAVGVGLFTAFSMLSHGGSIFALLPMFALALVFRQFYRWKEIVVSLLFFCGLYGLWILYQKNGDPPGDLLFRWHIAGTTDCPELSMIEVLMQQYRTLGWSGWLAAKQANLAKIVGDWNLAWLHFYPLQASSHFSLLRMGMFLSFGLAVAFHLPLLIWGILQVSFSKHLRFLLNAGHLLLLLLLGLTVWLLMMFSAGRTILHQGTYFFPFLAFMIAVYLFGAKTNRIGALLLIFAMAAHVVIWMMPSIWPANSPVWIQNTDRYNVASFMVLLLAFAWQITQVLRLKAND